LATKIADFWQPGRSLTQSTAWQSTAWQNTVFKTC